MSESFYGGQPGTSFIIVASYESIDEMVTNFKKGPSYEAVHFDEHVLINTYYKDDIDNGKIYRRGYDYTNDMGGAIYIGSIVGPPGAPPEIALTSVDDVIDKYNSEKHDNEDLHRLYEGEYAPLYDLVPGKDSTGTYRDSIKWACCSVHSDINPYYTIAYLGFIWPYLVVDYEANSVSPYYNRDSQNAGFTNTNLVDRTDDESHPFWEKWHISVPKGIKGDTFENFRVITASSNDGVESYDGQSDDRANGRQILVYDYYHFDKEEGGEPVTIYLGDYNMITGIIISEDGTITITYTHDDDTVFDKAIRWIDNVTLDPDGTLTIHFNTGEETVWKNILKWVTSVELTEKGHFTIEFNNGDDAYETDIVWVREITFEEDGIVTVIYNNGQIVTYPNIKWITEISLSENGDFHIGFNNGDEYDSHLTWVNDIVFSTDGTIEVHYNDGTDDFTYSGLIKWITGISLTDEGHFTIEFNNGDAAYETDLIWVREITFEEDGIVTVIYNNGQIVTYPNIKWITGINLDEDGSFHIEFNNGDEYNTNLVWVRDLSVQSDGTVVINYNDGTYMEQKNLIQWITAVELTDDGDFTIEFNNGAAAYTNHLTWVNDITFENDGTISIHYNDGTDDFTYKSLIKWITGIELTQDGTFTIDFNNGDTSYTTSLTWINNIIIDDDGTIHIIDNHGNNTDYNNYIKMINNISINTGTTEGTGNQKVHVEYNTGEEEDIGEPLNYIIRMEMVESDYHLLVWYSDPAKRQEIIDEGRSYTFDGEDGWFDLGSVKDESGILIGTNLEYELPEVIDEAFLQEIIDILNGQYPDGLQGVDLHGKIVTVGTDTIDVKCLFAYDYDLNTWYYIGTAGEIIQPSTVLLFDTDPQTKTDNLRTGGAWFVLEDFDIYD